IIGITRQIVLFSSTFIYPNDGFSKVLSSTRNLRWDKGPVPPSQDKGNEYMYKLLSWAAPVIWMAIIFYLSHQPSAASNELSSGLTEVIINKIKTIAPDREFNIEAFHHYVRKNAHFFAYLLLGVLVLHALRSSNILGYRGIIAALLICVQYAASDEIHQLFIAGRSGEVRDVLIDSAGASTGIGIWMVVARILGRKRS